MTLGLASSNDERVESAARRKRHPGVVIGAILIVVIGSFLAIRQANDQKAAAEINDGLSEFYTTLSGTPLLLLMREIERFADNAADLEKPWPLSGCVSDAFDAYTGAMSLINNAGVLGGNGAIYELAGTRLGQARNFLSGCGY